MIEFVTGDDQYRKKKYFEELAQSVGSFNLVELTDPVVKDLIQEILSPPLFATDKVVIVHLSSDFSWDVFIEFYDENDMPSSIRLYFDTENIPVVLEREVAKKVYNTRNEKALSQYLTKRLQEYGFDLDKDTRSYLFYLVGVSEQQIDNCLAYLEDLGQYELDISFLQANVAKVRDISPYEILDYISKGEAEYVLYLVKMFVRSAENCASLASILAWRIKQWLFIKTAEKQRILRRDLQEQLNLSNYVVGKLVAESEKFSYEFLLSNFLKAINITLKSDNLALETLILALTLRKDLLESEKNFGVH